MKRSIATKVAVFVMILLVIAMIILFIGTFSTFTKVISREKEQYSEAVLGIYSNLLMNYSNTHDVPLDGAHGEDVVQIGTYICDKYGADFVYLYTIDEENSAVRYVGTAASEEKMTKENKPNLVDYYLECDLTAEELALWHEKTEMIHATVDNSYGHENMTLTLVYDSFNNKAIAGVDMSYQQLINQIAKDSTVFAIVILDVLVGVGVAVFIILRKYISKPAQKISKTMQDYISDGKRSSTRLEVKGKNEYSMISSAFNTMTDNIDSYIKNIQNLTQEQANRKAELDIASGIQRGLLKDPNANYDSFDINAVMIPAKDIGGDLYDYIKIDDRQTLIVIADVSGKGITAAMFMSMTLTLIRQFAKMRLMPNEILENTNHTLSNSNPELLFVTAFIGLYNSETKTLTYSNAGHNIPYVLGDTLTKLDKAKGTFLGIYEDEKYDNESIVLNSGESVFLYTDGVNEAVNEYHEFFGDDNLEAALLEYRYSKKGNIVDYILNKIKLFSGNEEQHDDITMLALTTKDSISLKLDYKTEEFEKIKDELLKLPIPHSEQLNLCLAAEEIFVNIVSYAFENGVPANEKIEFTLSTENGIRLCFTDGGMKYNPLEEIYSPNDSEESDDLQLGGLGKFLYVSLSDETKYEYINGKNILTIIKYITEENK